METEQNGVAVAWPLWSPTAGEKYIKGVIRQRKATGNAFAVPWIGNVCGPMLEAIYKSGTVAAREQKQIRTNTYNAICKM